MWFFNLRMRVEDANLANTFRFGNNDRRPSRYVHVSCQYEAVSLMITGRRDLSVHHDTVDFEPPARIPALDETEFQISYQFVYFLRTIRNVAGTMRIYAKVKRLKNWYLDSEFVGHDQMFPKWLNELPHDLLVVFPEDGSAPYLPSPFIANMNCYHYLSVIMQHRPQVHYLTATDGNWRHHMIVCHDAAKKICRIQEAILRNYGLPGMVCMQRGISFTVYCVLTCVMLHLVGFCPSIWSAKLIILTGIDHIS